VSSQPRVVILAAHDRRHAIGRDGQLPWHLPDDLRRFKALTLDKTILMGRKTAQSLGRALPRRRNLVLTRSGQVPFAGMEAIASLDQALQLSDGELCVIGGGEIYSLCLPIAQVLHLTLVDVTVEGADAYFPPIEIAQWRESNRIAHVADGRHAQAFSFVDYLRNS